MLKRTLVIVAALAWGGCAEGEAIDPSMTHLSGGAAGVGGQAGVNSTGGAGGSSTGGGTGSGGSNGQSGSSGQSGTGGQSGSGASGGAPQGDASAGGAGQGGTGGTGGSGGSSGASGASGSGGSGGSAAIDAGVIAGFSVLYTNGATQASDSSVIKCVLSIANNGTETVPLNQLTMRYYYTNEITVAVTIDTNSAHVGGGAMYSDLTNKIVKQNVKLMPAKAGADSYVELGFADGSPSLAPGEEAAFVDWQIHDTNYAQHYNQANDYSFDATKTGTAKAWDHVALYRSGTTLLWGTPPP